MAYDTYGTRCKYCRHTSGNSACGKHFKRPLNGTLGSPEHSVALNKCFAAYENFNKMFKILSNTSKRRIALLYYKSICTCAGLFS